MRSMLERFIQKCLEPADEDTVTGRLRNSIARERSGRPVTSRARFLRHFFAHLGRHGSVAVIRQIGSRRTTR
ncbi:MAG TPA: hypothetical protein VF057_09195 [Thermoanaerobaculia bacterium]